MTATLPADLQEFVQAEIEGGHFANMDQLLEAGVRLLQERKEELKALLQVGIDQLDRGESEPFDPMVDLEEAKMRLAQRKAGAA